MGGERGGGGSWVVEISLGKIISAGDILYNSLFLL